MGNIAKEQLIRSLRLQGGLPDYSARAIAEATDSARFIFFDDSPDLTGAPADAPVSFYVGDPAGNPVPLIVKVELLCTDDIKGVVPALKGTLDTASSGSILLGAGSRSLVVETAADGTFACRGAHNESGPGLPKTLYYSCKTAAGGPGLNCVSFDSITWSS